MDIQTLRKHVLALATLEETAAPMISCYLNLESGLPAARELFDERARWLRKSLPGLQRDEFEEALRRIETCLDAGFESESKGAAVFSRAGGQEYFLALQFRVPLPTWVAVNSTPNVYHLVELKDTYHRYVVVLVNERHTRILEVHLGSVMEAAYAKRPELRERMGRGWSREHYQSHRRERNHQFANEVVKCLDEVMSAGDYGHLILAGPPKMTALLKQALPKRLEAKLIDVVPASTNDRTSDIVSATLESFVEQEQKESLAAVEKLLMEICRHGLAVAGSSASLQALRGRQVDMLVMASEYAPEPAWICSECGTAAVQLHRPSACLRCGCVETRELDVKEELARLAELVGCGVEIVNDSEPLLRLGGVGCLLRYRSPESYGRAAA